MKLKLVNSILGVLLLLMVISCTAPSAPRAEANAPAAGNEEDTSTAPVNSEVHNVAIENFQFMPTDVEVKVGDTVVWTNKDSTAHTVTFSNGNVDENLPSGGTATYTITEKGIFPYFCQFHPSMRGTVQVN